MSRLLAVATAALFAAPAPADDALLAAARKANRAAVEAVKTWRAKTTYQTREEPDPGPAVGQFTRAGRQVRGRVTVKGETTEAVRTPAGQRVLVLNPAAPGDATNYGEAHAGPMPLPPGDPWECGLFGVHVDSPDTATRPLLDDWLAGPDVQNVTAEPATHAGQPVVRVKVATRRWGFDHEFDLDPAVGHLVRVHRAKCDSPARRDAPATPMASEAVVTEFKEVKPGGWVPVAVTCTNVAAGRQVGYEWAATEAAVNDPLPADAWELTFPAGLRLVDNVKEGVFRTDATGQPGEWARNPAGQPYRFDGQLPPPEVAAASPPASPPAAGMDPTVVWPIALVAAVAVAGVTVVVVGLGRRRK